MESQNYMDIGLQRIIDRLITCLIVVVYYSIMKVSKEV